jgi:glycosyltransferase involved in cell wall biosynthesis
MKFSICIPNYNYAPYLGKTIRSVLDQEGADFEVLVSDNASTDGSVAVVRELGDPRIHLHVNACNVGFAGNLDRAARLATGDCMIMLSSDDLMRAGALATYRKLWDHLGPLASGVIASATWEIIDPEDRVTGYGGPDPGLWLPSDRKPELESVVGAPVYGVAADELLRRCLPQMKNPFNFAATVYAARLYHQVEGYGGGRMINPDKWFHWKALSAAGMAYFIDARLFAYRWHGNNQMAQETATGALKYLIDEYVSTLELDAALLGRLGVTRESVAEAFVEYDIARHGLATLACGQRVRARRILDFGRAAYPWQVRRNRRAWALRALLALGPLGEKIAARAYRAYRNQNGNQASQ